MTTLTELKNEILPGEATEGAIEVGIDEMVFNKLGKGPVMRWVQEHGAKAASQELKNLLGALYKGAAFKGGAGAIEKAKEAFLRIFPAEASTFDMVLPRPVYNHELKAAGVPESALGGGPSFGQPLIDAQAEAFAEELPGGLSDSLASACFLLRRNPELIGGKLELNEMTGFVDVGRRPLRDHDVSEARVQIEQRFTDRKGNPIKIGKDTAWDALLAVAAKSPYHPVREYLRALKWDGVPRLDAVVKEVLHADDRPINSVMFRKFAIAAVARVEEPGAKADNMFVIVGEQGMRKSSFFKVLAGEEFFTDAPIDFENPKHLMVMRSAWIVEFGEMKSLLAAKSEEAIKAGLTRTEDRYVPPYGRAFQIVKRHNVFGGTANPTDLLRDPTGNRRYWPVTVNGEIDLCKLAAWRDQLWAEAVVAYRAGEKWFLDKDQAQQAAEAQADYMKTDAWEGKVLQFAEQRTREARDERKRLAATGAPPESMPWGEFDLGVVLQDVIGLFPDRQDAKAESRVKTILITNKYVMVRPNTPKGVTRHTFYIWEENASAFKAAYSAKLRKQKEKDDAAPPPVQPAADPPSEAGDF